MVTDTMTRPSAYGDDSDFPPIDQEGPRAPVAKIGDFEDLSIDGSCYALSSICNTKNGITKFTYSYKVDESFLEKYEEAEEENSESKSEENNSQTPRSTAIFEYPEIKSIKERCELDCDDLSIMDTEIDLQISK